MTLELFPYKETEILFMEIGQNFKLKYLRNYTKRVFTTALGHQYLSNIVEKTEGCILLQKVAKFLVLPNNLSQKMFDSEDTGKL